MPSKRGAVFQSQSSQCPVVMISGDGCRAPLLDLAQLNRVEPVFALKRRVFPSQANDMCAPSLLHLGVDTRQATFRRRPVNRGQNCLDDPLTGLRQRQRVPILKIVKRNRVASEVPLSRVAQGRNCAGHRQHRHAVNSVVVKIGEQTQAVTGLKLTLRQSRSEAFTGQTSLFGAPGSRREFRRPDRPQARNAGAQTDMSAGRSGSDHTAD